MQKGEEILDFLRNHKHDHDLRGRKQRHGS